MSDPALSCEVIAGSRVTPLVSFALLTVPVTARPEGGPARRPDLRYDHAPHGYPYLIGARKTGPTAGAVSAAKGSTSACGRLGSSSVT